MGEPNDEISLRELYLILRGGLRLILASAVLVAAITLAVLLLVPREYRATATVRVAPIQVQGPSQGSSAQSGQTQTDLVDVNAITQLGFDAYRTIALSAGVLEATLKAVPSSGDLTRQRLSELASIAKVSGGGSEPLIVTHTVSSTDPAQAAALANAWAQASAAAARASVASSLATVRGTLSSELASLSSALDDAEARWADFQKQDARASLQAQLDAIDARTTTAQTELDGIDRKIATTKAQDALLQAVVDARKQGTPADLANQLQALAASGAVSAVLAQQLTEALTLVPQGPGLADQDLATVVARTELQQRAADLAGYVAERSTVEAQLAGFSKQAADLRGRLADQQQTAQALQRNLDTATNSYRQVAGAAPLFDVADKLVPALADVFGSASPPEQPQSRRVPVMTVAAFVLTAAVMVVFVLLRAAVATDGAAGAVDPPASRPAGSATGGHTDADG